MSHAAPLQNEHCGTAEFDRQLVDRCLAGHADAWEELFGTCHQPLMLSIRLMLVSGPADPNLVEEIAARVWFSAISDGARILNRFDPQHGYRLHRYLASLARNEASVLLRSERRRRRREQVASRRGVDASDDPSSRFTSSEWREFLVGLTAGERRFLDRCLLSHGSQETEYSDANRWQLTTRIRKKLTKFVQQLAD